MTWESNAWTRNVQKRDGVPFLMERRTAKLFGENSFFGFCLLSETRIKFWESVGFHGLYAERTKISSCIQIAIDSENTIHPPMFRLKNLFGNSYDSIVRSQG